MDIRLNDHFDALTLKRAREYMLDGLVVSVKAPREDVIEGRVSNGRGTSYTQQITLKRGLVDGRCTRPVGDNCKHVAAVLMVLAAQQQSSPSGLAGPLQGWLRRVKERAASTQHLQHRPDDYPYVIKGRLLYVLKPNSPGLRVEIYKGQVNAAGTGLNKTIRRYDATYAMRSAVPDPFIRPVDLELLSALALSGLWDVGYGYSLTEHLRPKGTQAIALIRRLCDTGRFLHDAIPETRLTWSDTERDAQLGWRIAADGSQQLGFEDATGAPLNLRDLNGATLWIDPETRQVGALAHALDPAVLELVAAAPKVAPEEAQALTTQLPDRLAGSRLPRPHPIRQTRRVATERFARLTLGAETARNSARGWGAPVQLPTLTLRYVYEGHEVREGDPDPRHARDGEIVTLTRDQHWEAACTTILMEAGALLIEALQFHRPGERMLTSDMVFADGEINGHRLEFSRMEDALSFAFRVVPDLRRKGWEVIETPRWPYRLSHEAAALTVATHRALGEAFQGNNWFSLGFQAELGGKPVDVAPLIAAFLEQVRADWDEVPDVETLARHLAKRPIFLNRGSKGYVELDLSPLAPLLHLFLNHHAELGALHPSDAGIAKMAQEALEGSDVRFADKAGILPLARSLQALTDGDTSAPPAGLKAHLRDYQAYGVGWMGHLLEAGFGGVLADDMGLGKTIQTLAVLQARREAGARAAALLIMPTSLLHSWRTQAERFTPDLSVVILHGPDRAVQRDAALQADLVMTTYPLLARDREWLATKEWPLVILDEAHTLKNPAAQMAKALRAIPAQRRLALTGTPLENSLQDLWTLVDWVNPGLLGDRKGFQKVFRTPIEKHGDAATQARLNRRLRPFMLRRTKEQVASELPAKTEILERVDLSKPQQALYETVRSAMDARVREAISTRGLAGARITVLDALLKLRQVCCDPGLVKTAAARSVADSAKRSRLLELLEELVAEGRRVLVFSQFVEMLRMIEADLAKAGIPCLTLTGQTQKRAAVLDAFARGDAPVFLLSLKAAGVGLTLTEADTVILYDPWWNPAVERQAMDRAHRIGQDKPVFVHRLVAAGTVEERILDMQARKQALADALFDVENDAGDTLLDEATLHDLFAPLVE